MNEQKVEHSAIWAVISIIILFSGAVSVTLIAPSFLDPSWHQPSSLYQVQMYEVSDPHLFISSAVTGGPDLQYVYHLKQNLTLLAFKESKTVRISAPLELEKYVTKEEDKELKLTSRLLLLRAPQDAASEKALRDKLKADEEIYHEVLELYDPGLEDAFSISKTDGIVENWIDSHFTLLEEPQQDYHRHEGVIYILNPQEYRITPFRQGSLTGFKYDPLGKPVANVEELQNRPLGFRSKKELIALGEHIYAIEGCYYCHTDQTRTLVQDVVVNGSDSFPAPPSSANEYIYQNITFPGTRRIGPDISRSGIKRPARDWHKSHFWSPKTASPGSIMPSFRHFFDFDPRGTPQATSGIPNHQFEAIYQYLMTKGTRITPPTQAWWLGDDPIQTKEIIEGRKKVP